MTNNKLHIRGCIIEDLNDNLSNRDFCWFIRMIQHVKYDDCSIRDVNNRYLNAKQISEILAVDYNNFSSALKKFENLNLIKKVDMQSQKDIYKKVKVIVVNPFLYSNIENIKDYILNEFSGSKYESDFYKL